MDLPPIIQHVQNLEIAGGGQPRADLRPQVRKITFKGADGYFFNGELTLPQGARVGERFPTVVLLHGSGLNDLNYTLPEKLTGHPGGSAIFKQMNVRLNAAGYAVLRYNKRGVVAAGPVPMSDAELEKQNLNISQVDRDAQAALNFVRTQSEVNAGQVFLLGQSEGTIVASHIGATQPDKVAGLILIGTVGESFRDTLHGQMVERPLAQMADIMDANGDGLLTTAELEKGYAKLGISLESQAEALGVVKQGKTWTFHPDLRPDAQGRVSIQGALRDRLENQFTFPEVPGLQPVDHAYFADAEKFGSAAKWLKTYQGPVLMLQGDKDSNTTLASAQKAYQALKQGGNTQATLKVYEGLGHTLSPTEQDGQVDRFGPMVHQPLNDLVNWLNQVRGH